MESVGGEGGGEVNLNKKKKERARAAHFFETHKRHIFSQKRSRRRRRRRRVRVGRRRTARVNLYRIKMQSVGRREEGVTKSNQE